MHPHTTYILEGFKHLVVMKLIVCRSYSKNMLFFPLCLLLFASFVEPFLRKNRMDIFQNFNLVMIVAY